MEDYRNTLQNITPPPIYQPQCIAKHGPVSIRDSPGLIENGFKAEQTEITTMEKFTNLLITEYGFQFTIDKSVTQTDLLQKMNELGMNDWRKLSVYSIYFFNNGIHEDEEDEDEEELQLPGPVIQNGSKFTNLVIMKYGFQYTFVKSASLEDFVQQMNELGMNDWKAFGDSVYFYNNVEATIIPAAARLAGACS